MRNYKRNSLHIFTILSCLLFSGCHATYNVLHRSLAVRNVLAWSEPSSEKTSADYAYTAPRVEKTPDGNLELEVDVLQYRVGLMGDGGYNSDQYLGVRRETFLVERAELSPLPVEPDLGIETYIHEHRKWTIVADPEAFVLPGKSLPFVYDTSRFRKDGLELYYPEQECLVNDFRRVYWFVPAKTLDEGPQVALVTEHEWYHAPPYTYPVRAVLLPVALAADCAEGILISPLLFAVYMGWLSPV